jgi:predicted transcriptional regulator YheO
LSKYDCRRVDRANVLGRFVCIEAGLKAPRPSSVAKPDQCGGKVGQAVGRDADRRLQVLAEIIGPLTRSLGANCEIVLHDYRIPDRSVVAVAGKVTERQVGSAMSEIGLAILAEGDQARDRLNYLAKAPNGRIINSSTIVLRDGRQRVFGALCINVDVTAIRHAAAILDALSNAYAEPKPTTFTNDINDVIDVALREVLAGRAPTLLSRQERLDVIRSLEVRGIFNVKRASGRVAAALGVSRATAYGCLQQIRSETNAASSAAGRPEAKRLSRREP